MKEIPQAVSESTKRRNPHLYPSMYSHPGFCGTEVAAAIKEGKTPKRIRPQKPLLNITEQRCAALLLDRGVGKIFKQSFTLRLDPPYRSYTPDLAFLRGGLVFVEVKGLHRFRRAGIAKAALAAKTYPQFRFELFEWDGKAWKESVLSS